MLFSLLFGIGVFVFTFISAIAYSLLALPFRQRELDAIIARRRIEVQASDELHSQNRISTKRMLERVKKGEQPFDSHPEDGGRT